MGTGVSLSGAREFEMADPMYNQPTFLGRVSS